MSEQVEITRYPNRRLYDRSRKKYVTVGDIEAMVLGGQDVRVRDSKSAEDLTRVILIQILLERHPERMRMFPVAFLHAILRADQMALNWLTVYFGQAMTVMNGITASSGTKLVPGMEFWKSFMPETAKNKGVEETPSGEVELIGPQDDQPAQQATAERLAELDRRLRDLESEPSADKPSDEEAGD